VLPGKGKLVRTRKRQESVPRLLLEGVQMKVMMKKRRSFFLLDLLGSINSNK
jgi:hypothetical protein